MDGDSVWDGGTVSRDGSGPGSAAPRSQLWWREAGGGRRRRRGRWRKRRRGRREAGEKPNRLVAVWATAGGATPAGAGGGGSKKKSEENEEKTFSQPGSSIHQYGLTKFLPLPTVVWEGGGGAVKHKCINLNLTDANVFWGLRSGGSSSSCGCLQQTNTC